MLLRAPSTPKAAPAGQDAEALIEEARRRQRRRRRWVAVGCVCALGLALGSVLTEGGSGKSRPPVVNPRSGGGALGVIQRTASAPSGSPGTFVMAVGGLGGQSAWAINGQALFLSDDGGQTWTIGTPPILADQGVGDRVNSIVGYGTNKLWLGAIDVIGLVPYSQSINGSDRGMEVLRSTDGGRTWQPSFLPGCVQACGGNVNLDFVDPQHGFAAVVGAGTSPGYLFATSNGGATWSLVSRAPSSNFSVAFANTQDGWAVSGFSGFPGQPTGSLFRTTDGGKTWSTATRLPDSGTYGLPVFFNDNDGLVLRLTPAPDIYTTADGGTSWQAHAVPVFVPSGRLAPSPLLSAPNPGSWFISWGRRLLETTDSGQRWTNVNEVAAWPSSPGPGAPKGSAWDLVFFSPTTGWAVVGNDCSHPWGCSGQVIITTSDKGLTWKYLNP